MGDGLHHESDGKWIESEYRKIAKLLYPEAFTARRKKNAAMTDERVAKVISEQKCDCGGDLKQVRKGAKVMQCQKCPKKYKIVIKRENGNGTNC